MESTLTRGLSIENPRPTAFQRFVYDPLVVSNANSLLGYSSPVKHLKRRTLKAQEESDLALGRSNTIRQDLSRSDYPPFEDCSVSLFKKRREFEVRRGWEKQQLNAPYFVCIWLIGLAVSILSYFYFPPLGSKDCAGACITACGIFTFLYIWLASNVSEPEFYLWDTKSSWPAIPIDCYIDQIPEYALQIALDLKREHGDDISLMVETLTTKRCDENVGEVVQTHDSFLRADLPDGSQYYLETWATDEYQLPRVV